MNNFKWYLKVFGLVNIIVGIVCIFLYFSSVKDIYITLLIHAGIIGTLILFVVLIISLLELDKIISSRHKH